MKNINWIVRLKNKTFWATIIPAAILLITQAAGIFGVHLDLSDLQGKLVDIVGTVFMILAVIGVVTDPTTKGIKDSNRALTYSTPATDTTEEAE